MIEYTTTIHKCLFKKKKKKKLGYVVMLLYIQYINIVWSIFVPTYNLTFILRHNISALELYTQWIDLNINEFYIEIY